MICNVCLNNIPNGAETCPVCGSLANAAVPQQNSMASVGGTTETARIPFCDVCSLELEEGAKFCPVCGAQAGYKEKSSAYAAIYGSGKINTSVQAMREEEQFGDFAGLDGAAAMSSVKPIKKKSRVPLIAGISAAAAVVVLGGVFALNRTTFLPMIMGEAGYAAMIEAKSAAAVVEQLSDNVIVNAAVENTAKNMAIYAAIAQDSGTSVSAYSRLSAKSVISQINAQHKEFGASAQSVEISPSIQLTSAGREILFGDESEYDELVNALNCSEITLSSSAQENAAAFGISLDENGTVTDANIIISDENAIYIDVPFAGKAFKYDFSDYISEDEEHSEFTLDSKETARIIAKISDIYIERFKMAQYTVESGELTAAGVTANGQLVCCEMDSDCLSGLFEDIFTFLAEDEYLSKTITDYINANGGEISAEEYAETVKSFAENIVDEECALKVSSIVNKSCEVIAKSIVCISGSSEASFTYVNGKSKAALEIINGDDGLTADLTRQNKSDGTINVKYTGDKSFSAKAVYKDLKEATYGGKKTFDGTIRLSCVPPTDFSESGSFAAVYAALSKAELAITQNVEHDALKQHIELSIPQYGTAAIDAVTSAAQCEITIPENAFELNTLYEDDNYKELGEILSAIAKSADKDAYFAGKISEAAQSAAQDIEDSFKPQADYYDVMALQNNIDFLIETAESLYESHADVMTDEYRAQCDDIIKRFKALKETIESEYSNYNMTLERYEELDAQEYAIDEELAELITALNKAQDANVPISQRGEIDYSDLSADEVCDAFSECESDFLSIIMVYYGDISEDEELLALYNTTLDAYEEASDKCWTLMEEMSKGNWAVQLVRNARRAAEDFDKALSALEAKLSTSGVLL